MLYDEMEQFIFQTEPYEDFYEVKEELGRYIYNCFSFYLSNS